MDLILEYWCQNFQVVANKNTLPEEHLKKKRAKRYGHQQQILEKYLIKLYNHNWLKKIHTSNQKQDSYIMKY